MQRYLITGATGFVGSHVAEECGRRHIATSAIVRPATDAGFLEKLGTTIHRGDLADQKVVQRAVEGIDVVVHAAAKVGDWGPVEDYRAINVEALRHLLEACVGKNLKRFLHVSSLGVYEARHHHGTDETEPLPPRHMDGYTQTKVESEKLVLEYHRDRGVPVTVVRPGFIYGPRDRTVLPRLMQLLKAGEVRYLARGRYALNTTYVGNLVEAIFLAIDNPKALGQVYNITDGECVSKRQFIESIADGAGLPRPSGSVPLWLARIVAGIMERRARRKGATEAPRLTQARVKFLGLNLDFSIDKARRELGYRPRMGFRQAMQETMAYYRSVPRD